MFCQNCGNKIKEGAEFCSFCGTEAKAISEKQEEKIAATEEKKSSGAKTILDKIVTFTSIVVGLIIGKYLGLIVFVFIFAWLIGQWFPKWYSRREHANIALVKWIVW